ncbi:MAG: hypothetical protein B7Y29_01960 [Thiotrichales bacterium 16-46-22]|nr:MAG: hypothetical protein B7Y29_01960 [Thiotrichales bacterium 16-46-22]
MRCKHWPVAGHNHVAVGHEKVVTVQRQPSGLTRTKCIKCEKIAGQQPVVLRQKHPWPGQVACGHHVEIVGLLTPGFACHQRHLAGKGHGHQGLAAEIQTFACQTEPGAGKDGQVPLDPWKDRKRPILHHRRAREAEDQLALVFQPEKLGRRAATVFPRLAGVVGGGQVTQDHAHIGNFVELKNAQLGSGAKVNHLSYVGDASVGAKANIGAGTITCNYDGVNKHRTVIGEGAFVGSNSALVAPVTVGAGATIGAGSVITKDTPDDQLTLARAKQVTIATWQRPVKK